MRTNILIDDLLMAEALQLTGLTTKREAVELALRTLVEIRRQEKIRQFKGRLKWEGNLDEIRGAE